MLYTVFVIGTRVYREKRDQLFEVLNEIVVLLTIYFLMMFTGFVLDPETREACGLLMIGLTIGNIIVNTLPIALSI